MAQKITQKQLEKFVGEDVMTAIRNKEIELLKRSEFDPCVKIQKLKTTSIELAIELTTDDKDEKAITCTACKRTWVALKGFTEHIVGNQCKKFK